MTKRLFYSCPIKALFMMKEFGVRIEIYNKIEDEFIELSGKNLRNEIKDEEVDQYYVSEESEAIFEPKYRDIGVVNGVGGIEEGMFNGTKWIFRDRHCELQNAQIIMRDWKQFFDAERE